MLLDKTQLGSVELSNRMIMAPLTRARADAGHMPNNLMAEYYAQRASAGLIITECTMIAPGTSAFVSEPGIYNDEQINAWKKTTDAVHAAGGKIFMQIWHSGRAAHPLMNNGTENVGPSAIAIDGEVHTPKGKAANTEPRALREDELPTIVVAFKQAALNAIEAGFDGVEVHGANGYLLDAFLRDGSNKREDAYGGSLENRARLLLEVLKAVTGAIGAGRVGVRLSPLNSYNSMRDGDPVALVSYLAEQLNQLDLAYVHLMRADFFNQQEADVVTPVRQNFKGNLMLNMGYSADEAEQVVKDGQADFVAFGTGFLANPDLPARVKAGAEWNTPNPDTFYTPGAKGYTDYPTMD